MCYTTKRSACLCACVDTHTWLLLFPEPSANMATRVHPLSPVRTVLATGTEHSLQTRHFSHSISFHLHPSPLEMGMVILSFSQMRKLRILRAPVPHYIRVTNCSMRAKPPGCQFFFFF